MVAPLAQPIGGLGIATRTEGALMQPLNGELIVGDFRPDGEGKISHRLVFGQLGTATSASRDMRFAGMRLAFGGAQVYCGLSAGAGSAPNPRLRGRRPSCQPGRAVCRSASTMSAANRR